MRLIADLTPDWRRLIGEVDSDRRRYATLFLETLECGDQEVLQELFSAVHEMSQGGIRSRIVQCSTTEEPLSGAKNRLRAETQPCAKGA